MEQFKNCCLSCHKPLAPEEKKCDECHHICIETENLDEKIFLLYLKYLENKNLHLNAIRADKLNGYTNFNFDPSLQFLDDEETTGHTLVHYISKKYPDLIKVNFIGLGFNSVNKSIDDKNIEKLKKNILKPIVSRIKESYALFEKVELENELLFPHVFLKQLFKTTVASTRLYFTFQYISSAEFRFEFEAHLKSNQIDIESINKDGSQKETLLVLKEKAFSQNTRDIADYLYHLELCIGSRKLYQRFQNEVPDSDSNFTLKAFEHSIYLEKLVQLLSYKTHFPMLNRDSTKIFRNSLNLKPLAETLRVLQQVDADLDPWIYLACEEVMIPHSIDLDEDKAIAISQEFHISLQLALNGEFPKTELDLVRENEKYEQLLWLLTNEKIERNLKVITVKRLNIFQLYIFKEMLLGLKKGFDTFEHITLSKEAKEDIVRHFLSEEHPNKRLFKQYESIASEVRSAAWRLKDVFEALTPSSKEASEEIELPNLNIFRTIEHNELLKQIWNLPKVYLTRLLFEKIENLGEKRLSHFIADGPYRGDEALEHINFTITDGALEYVVEKFEEDIFGMREINRLFTIIENFACKNDKAQDSLERSQLIFSKIDRFSGHKK